MSLVLTLIKHTFKMNRNIQNLYKIAGKSELQIIGLMSGTSLDGLDIALCTFSGSGSSTAVQLRQFTTIPYGEDVKQKIRQVFAKQTIDFQHLCILNPWIGTLHAEMILEGLKSWNIPPEEIDIIASHGQTVYHAPKSFHKLREYPNSTLQIGDGDHIAQLTGIITISDFRQKHCAAGGEGAPLALYGDYLLFSKKGETRIMLNIGGIANFTYLPGSLEASEVFSTDTGPGNTLLDAFSLKLFNQPYDRDGQFARAGKVNKILLKELKSNEFFTQEFPKTAGPETFNDAYVENCQRTACLSQIGKEELLATLTRFSAETIAEAVDKSLKSKHEQNNRVEIYYSGGGAHNPELMTHLKELLPWATFEKTDVLGIPADAKEAVLFATLVNEALKGGRTNFGENRKSVPSVSMGKISFPG